MCFLYHPLLATTSSRKGIIPMAGTLALVIEDNRDQGNIFGEAIRLAGMEVEIIRDGSLARRRLAEVAPGLVILDMHLPGVSGEELLQDLRSDPRFAATRIVIASADGELVNRLRPQVDYALEKPVSFSQLRLMSARLQLGDKRDGRQHAPSDGGPPFAD
jgi:DNA-binding response OmpR family regulator